MSDSIVINVNLSTNPITVVFGAPAAAVSVNFQTARDAYQLAVVEGYVGTRAEWLASLKGTDGQDGTNGTNGQNGRNPEINNNGTAIEWRLAGDPTWTMLVNLADLKGDPGTNGSDASVTTANVGTALAAAASKTLPVDADSITILDSAASNAPKLLSFANLWVWIKSMLDTALTIAGAKTFSGKVTLNGQGALAALDSNDAMTKALAQEFDRAERAQNGVRVFGGGLPSAFGAGTGGSAVATIPCLISFSVGGAIAGTYRGGLFDYLARVATWSGSYYSFSKPFILSCCFALRGLAEPNRMSIRMGPITGGLLLADQPCLNARGLALEFGNTTGSSYDVRFAYHDGTTYKTSAWVSISVAAGAYGRVFSLVMTNDGAGRYSVYVASNASEGSETTSRPNIFGAALMSITDGPTGQTNSNIALFALASTSSTTGSPANQDYLVWGLKLEHLQ